MTAKIKYAKGDKRSFDKKYLNACIFDEAGCARSTNVRRRWQITKETLKDEN